MTIQSKAILRQLKDGLILRRSMAADAEPLAVFNASLHGADETRRLLNTLFPKKPSSFIPLAWGGNNSMAP